jgi:hypothetical protein
MSSECRPFGKQNDVSLSDFIDRNCFNPNHFAVADCRLHTHAAGPKAKSESSRQQVLAQGSKKRRIGFVFRQVNPAESMVLGQLTQQRINAQPEFSL